MRFFEFDGVSSETFGTYVTASNMYDSPEEEVDVFEIPFSNKFVDVSKGTFRPFKLKVTCLVYQDMENNLRKLRNFLQTRGKAGVYKETANADEYRIARFRDAFVVRKTDYEKMATFVIEFDCFPQRYMVSNNNISLPVSTSSSPNLINSNYFGEPIIVANSTGSITWNGIGITVNVAPVTINCQTLQCYNGSVNRNNDVILADFPTIVVGRNTVVNSMALTVTPNYWRL